LSFDAGIREAVRVLWERGVDTCQSCDGQHPGHSYPDPTVDFTGTASEGWNALAIALACGLPVRELCRVYEVRDSEPHGPIWRMVLRA
jgi:hypothetical protein